MIWDKKKLYKLVISNIKNSWWLRALVGINVKRIGLELLARICKSNFVNNAYKIIISQRILKLINYSILLLEILDSKH